MKNDLYKSKYGNWAGRPDGSPPDFERCCEEVGRDMGRWTSFGQCLRKRGYGPDKAYCKTHDPKAVEERSRKRDEVHREKHNKERYKWYGRTFYEALKVIADGHNDARGHAQEVLNNFHKGEL